LAASGATAAWSEENARSTPASKNGVPAGHDIGICEHCSNDGHWVQAQLCCIRCKLMTCDTCGQWLGVLKGQPDPGRFERGPWMCWICQGLWAHELIGSFATMALQDQEKGKSKGKGKASGISVSDDGKGCPGISLAHAKGKGKDPGERWMTRVNRGPRCEPADADYFRECRRKWSELEGSKGTGYDSGKGKGPEDGDGSSNVPPYAGQQPAAPLCRPQQHPVSGQQSVAVRAAQPVVVRADQPVAVRAAQPVEVRLLYQASSASASQLGELD
jgi:hypothetical protein